LVAETGSEEAAFARVGAIATPLARYATAAEIADGIAFLLSDRAAFMTGAAQVVDGGYAL
jgi:2-keto-3-deoxy-L-fuconate dehydrogenase